MRRFCLVLCCLSLTTPLLADDGMPFVLEAVEKKFNSDIAKAQADVTHADAELIKARKAAGMARLKAYKDRLIEVTKSGDFDKAQAVKARVESLEKDLVADSPAGRKTSKIPKDAMKFAGHTYALIKEPATWHVAKERCEELGGHLVCINNAKEQLFVVGLCGSALTSIGATDEVKEGVWINVDGSPAVISGAQIDNHVDLDHWMVWDGTHFVDWHAGGRGQYVCEWDR